MSPNAKQYPGLPFRRLKLMANGVWDESRKAFYPFRCAGGTSGSLPGKKGVHYYVKTASISASNSGIHAAPTSSYLVSTVGGAQAYLAYVFLPVTTADVPVSQSISVDVGVLCDSGAVLNFTMNADSDIVTVVYAEIPADDGPVQVGDD